MSLQNLYIEYSRKETDSNAPDKWEVHDLFQSLSSDGVALFDRFVYEDKIQGGEAWLTISKAEGGDLAKGKELARLECRFGIADIEDKVRRLHALDFNSRPSPKWLPNKQNFPCWFKKNWWIFALILMLVLAVIYRKKYMT